MRNIKSLFVVLALAFTVSSAPVLAADHSASDAVGDMADAAGYEFVQGAKEIVKPLIVVGKTMVNGVAFVLLKAEQGVIYVAEEAVYGLKYAIEGAKFVLVKTAQGIKWVAVKALEAAELVFDIALATTILVIDGIEYALIKLEDGFVFVAKAAIKAGKVVVRGVTYVLTKTAEGVMWVGEQSWKALKATARWAQDRVLITKVRTRLSTALVAGNVGSDTMQYFSDMSVNAGASEHLRRVSAAALAASKAFSGTFTGN